MTGQAVVFTQKADADAFAAQVDARLGYPKNGVEIGGGVHVPAAQARTARHGEVVQHPTLPRWRYPHDVPVQAEEAKGLTLPPTAAVQALDATWDLP